MFFRRLFPGVRKLLPVSAAAVTTAFSFARDVEAADQKLEMIRKHEPLNPSKYFKDVFLIKHSCALSYEAASGLCTQVYLALEQTSEIYIELMDELIVFYEDTVPGDHQVLVMPDWQERLSKVQKDVVELKKQISELEMLFTFSKRLLEVNAEVSFLGGAEFISTQASERLFSMEKAAESLMAKNIQREEDLAKAKAAHIEKTPKESSS